MIVMFLMIATPKTHNSTAPPELSPRSRTIILTTTTPDLNTPLTRTGTLTRRNKLCASTLTPLRPNTQVTPTTLQTSRPHPTTPHSPTPHLLRYWPTTPKTITVLSPTAPSPHPEVPKACTPTPSVIQQCPTTFPTSLTPSLCLIVSVENEVARTPGTYPLSGRHLELQQHHEQLPLNS